MNQYPMKKYIPSLIFFALLFTIPQNLEAQFFKKLQKSVEDKIEQEADRRAQRKTDKAIDDTFDKAEDAIDGKSKDEKKDANSTNSSSNSSSNNKAITNNTNDSNSKGNSSHQPNVVWSKFDFVPGETVIFEDGPSTDEENGEFPSRWDAAKGNAEIVNIDGEPAIVFPQRMSTIVPFLKTSKEDYLPEIFTVEFDCYFKSDEPSTSYNLILADIKNQSDLYKNDKSFTFKIDDDQIVEYKVGQGQTAYTYKGANNLKKGGEGIWRHVSLAFTKGKLKIYMDEVRLINIPHYPENPLGISIETFSNKDEHLRLVKNFRIAKGGVKYYDRVLSDGKIIVNGIKFDTNKASLKTESMGPINKIYELMQKQPDLNFSVEGHTDSDGGDEANMTLSKARGKAVMDKLIEMGIASNRLKSTGFGESKPLDNNSTPEGKANNRRVEFVKFTGTSSANSNSNTGAVKTPTVVWSKFDFVPGDTVIYEDGPSTDEENGEFPSRWDLVNGNAEIAEVDGEKVVIFPQGGTIVPFLKNSKEDYLPEVFTVEFDAYFQPEYEHRIIIRFEDSKNQKSAGARADFYAKSISFGNTSKKYSKNLSKGGWRHFSIAVTKDKLKIYLNDERLINIPHISFNPTGITLNVLGYERDAGHHQYVKNFRIAKGGVKYYDRVLSDGKIIVNGIKFDVNRASIKPESMGPINKIYQLMQKQPDLNFSVEGHTDSDGGDEPNLTLSKERGKSVMDKLIEMGISSNRLKSTGFGESKPIDNNSSPEGKANNRRVEFVKF